MTIQTYPTVRRGSSNFPIITFLQKNLNSISPYRLVEDGLFGQGTESAVKDFQLKNALVSDGVFGKSSWEQLQRRVPETTWIQNQISSIGVKQTTSAPIKTPIQYTTPQQKPFPVPTPSAPKQEIISKPIDSRVPADSKTSGGLAVVFAIGFLYMLKPGKRKKAGQRR